MAGRSLLRVIIVDMIKFIIPITHPRTPAKKGIHDALFRFSPRLAYSSDEASSPCSSSSALIERLILRRS